MKWSWTLLALLIAATLVAAQPAATVKPPPADNAAVKYWQAFAVLPTLDKDQEQRLQDWNKGPLDEAAQKLIAASETSRLYLHRAAKIRSCNWHLDYEDGFHMRLPHLIKARDLARLTALHARREVEQGRPAAAMEDVTALLTLARHVGSDPIMIGILVRYLIEGVALELMAAYLPELQGSLPKLLAAREALPPTATFPQAYGLEKEFAIQWLINRLNDAEKYKKDGWRDAWNAVFPDATERQALEKVTTLPEATRLLGELLPVTDQLARLVVLPKGEFDSQYPPYKAKVKSDNILANCVLSPPDKLLQRQQRNEAHWAMLKAGAAILQQGTDAVKAAKDPFGTGPFGYQGHDKGFELKSQLLYDGQPVSLRFGQHKK